MIKPANAVFFALMMVTMSLAAALVAMR